MAGLAEGAALVAEAAVARAGEPLPARITSTANPQVKELAALRDARDRRRQGRFLIEGVREIGRALEGEIAIETAVVCAELLTEATRRLADHDLAFIPKLEMTEAPFAKIAYRENPDGLVVVGRIPTFALADLPVESLRLVLIVEGTEKPGNLGAMLRTADAAGVDAVIVADPVVDALNPNVIRASLGTVFTTSLALAAIDDAIEWCRDHELDLVAGADDGERSLWDTDFAGPLGIVVGREASGLADAWKTVTRTVRIPMSGSSDSLNTATAAAILLYEAVRQRSVT